MYNKAVYKVDHIICDIISFLILMIIAEQLTVFDSLLYSVILFSAMGSGCIANKVVYTALNIFAVIGIIITWFGFGIDIETFGMILIESVSFF